MENLDRKLSEIIDRLSNAGFDHAPQAMELGAQAMFWDGLIQIVVSGLFFIMFLIMVVIALQSSRGVHVENIKEAYDLEGAIIGAIIVAAVSLAISIVIGTVTNPWLKVFNPEAALVKDLFL